MSYHTRDSSTGLSLLLLDLRTAPTPPPTLALAVAAEHRLAALLPAYTTALAHARTLYTHNTAPHASLRWRMRDPHAPFRGSTLAHALGPGASPNAVDTMGETLLSEGTISPRTTLGGWLRWGNARQFHRDTEYTWTQPPSDTQYNAYAAYERARVAIETTLCALLSRPELRGFRGPHASGRYAREHTVPFASVRGDGRVFMRGGEGLLAVLHCCPGTLAVWETPLCLPRASELKLRVLHRWVEGTCSDEEAVQAEWDSAGAAGRLPADWAGLFLLLLYELPGGLLQRNTQGMWTVLPGHEAVWQQLGELLGCTDPLQLPPSVRDAAVRGETDALVPGDTGALQPGDTNTNADTDSDDEFVPLPFNVTPRLQ